jgi:hypothetical protein
MAGRSYGASPEWVATSPNGGRDPNRPVYLKESEMKKPTQTWLVIDEDPVSINDAMFLVDMRGDLGLCDLPSRAHGNAYGINFNDGHAAIMPLRDGKSLIWPGGGSPLGGVNDWRALTNVTTHPL